MVGSRRWDRFWAFDAERHAQAKGDARAVAIIRIWRYGRVLAWAGLTSTLVLIGIAVAQLLGVVPHPPPVWVLVVDGVVLAFVLLAVWLSWRWNRYLERLL